mgnify:FL=1
MGDLYLTPTHLVFRPEKSGQNRYTRYNDLVKEIVIPYEEIVRAKRNSPLFGGLRVETNERTLKIVMASKKAGDKRKSIRRAVEIMKASKENTG